MPQTQPALPGETQPEARETEDTARLPHERDESASSQPGGEASGQVVGRQALEDRRRGLEDTSKAVELDRTYRNVKRDA